MWNPFIIHDQLHFRINVVSADKNEMDTRKKSVHNFRFLYNVDLRKYVGIKLMLNQN